MRWLSILIVLILAPVAFLVWLRTGTEDRLSELEVAPEPVVMAVEATESFDPQGVAAMLVWTEAPAVPAPAWSGLVTGVAVEPGDTVSSGEVVVTVDGVDRVAYQSETPLFRVLRRTDTGSDVAILERFLAEGGWFDGEPDTSFTSATSAAVDALGKWLGVAKPGGVFDPAWLVWVGAEPFVVSEVEARVGFPAPSPGSPLLAGLAQISAATLVSPNGANLELEGDRVLEVGEESILFIDGIPGAGELERLSRLVTPLSEQTGGTLKLAVGRVAFVVAATAIVADPDGSLCVFVTAGSGYEPRPVTLGGGRASTVDIVTGLGDGDVVLVNPGDVIESPACR